MATIRTEYTSNSKGQGVIVAKGGGKQRTLPYNHAASPEANHFNAMAAVAEVLGLPLLPRTETVEIDRGKSTTVLA